MAGRAGEVRDWLVDAAFRAIVGFSLALPYAPRVRAAGWIFAQVVAPLAGFRARVRENLAQVMPDLPQAEVRALMRAVPDNVGRSLIEIYSGPAFAAMVTREPLTGPGIAALDAAHAAGQPVVLVTGHVGNYDALRAAFAHRGFRLGALYSPMRNRFFNAHYVAAISAIASPMFPRGQKGMGQMLRFLKSGGMLGLAIDQRMRHGERLQFFGQTALTALSAAELALRYGALLVPVYAIRRADGLGFDILIEPAIPHTTPEAMTQALNDSLEALVRRHMGQWFWIHRRWKA